MRFICALCGGGFDVAYQVQTHGMRPTLFRKVVEPRLSHLQWFEPSLRSPRRLALRLAVAVPRGERDCSGLGTAPRPSLRSGPHFVRPDLLRKSVEPGLFHLRGFESRWRSRAQIATRFVAGFVVNIGGERGIRTLEGLLTLTPLAGVRLRPLGHLSGGRNHNEPESGWQRNALEGAKRAKSPAERRWARRKSNDRRHFGRS